MPRFPTLPACAEPCRQPAARESEVRSPETAWDRSRPGEGRGSHCPQDSISASRKCLHQTCAAVTPGVGKKTPPAHRCVCDSTRRLHRKYTVHLAAISHFRDSESVYLNADRDFYATAGNLVNRKIRESCVAQAGSLDPPPGAISQELLRPRFARIETQKSAALEAALAYQNIIF